MRLIILIVLAWVTGFVSANEPLEIRAMTFNIRYDNAGDGENAWAHRREMVVDLINASEMDVIGVQEALRHQLDEIRAGAPQFAEIGVGRDDGRSAGEHSSILYRHDRFAVAECGTFWLSDTPDEPGSTSWGNTIPRICTWARLVDIESGRPVLVYNTHFDHRSQASRERSAEAIVEHLQGRRDALGAVPVVVMGDFNAGEGNAAMRTLLGAGLVDSFRVVHPEETTVGTFCGFDPARTGGEKIDHVFVDVDATVVDAGIDRTSRDGRAPSDHFPVWAVVRR